MTRRVRKPRPDPAAAARQQAFDQAVAEARAGLDVLRQPGPLTPVTPPATAAGPADVAALVDEALARREAEAAAAAERAELERMACPDGRGCRRCGVSHAARQVLQGDADRGFTAHLEPGWERDGQGWRCPQCTADYFRMMGQTDTDRRIECIVDRLGGSVPFVAYAHAERFARVRVWFHEHPDAEPSTVPWAWLDLDRLRAVWDAAANPAPPDERPRRRGKRCDVCGTRTKLVEERTAELPSGSGLTVGTVEVEHCAECVRRWYAAAGANVEAAG
jgi:hypothetical protein